jgi:RNA polymerase sigma-70 factor (ECF subfamily)
VTARPGSDGAETATPTDPATLWLLAARDGDSVAAAAFVRETQAYVWRFVASLTHSSVADDLTQDTYLRAFRALPAFAGRASARTWLLAIARRVCADHIDGAARLRRLDARIRNEDGAAACAVLGSTVETTDLLNRLSAERRVALVLTQVLGLSYAEAAEVEGIAVGTIRSRVARARADLVTALNAARDGR